eukprot:TRINITY_DN2662_c0_g1_i1.p1 TRINITY_DN2662_c0_g1~~TRINITY_DN2662_c0_g1_i1.p1  ORF type:complete len:612 (-),score=154.92 TRINITY_DN2662_c0_g1_i1:95-1930(-)
MPGLCIHADGIFMEKSDGSLKKMIQKPSIVEFFEESEIKIVQVLCGGTFTLFRSDAGTVYSCGWDFYGEIGQGIEHEVLSVSHEPKALQSLILAGEEVTEMAAGFSHAIFITKRGNVYSCGYGMTGQLGHGSLLRSLYPKQLECFNGHRIISCAASSDHSLFLAYDGAVFACGKSTKGRLGLGETTTQVLSIPTKITALDGLEVCQVGAGFAHSLFLTKNGRVFGCGDVRNGEVGSISPDIIWSPVELEHLRGQHIASLSTFYWHTLYLAHGSRIDVPKCSFSYDRYRFLTGPMQLHPERYHANVALEVSDGDGNHQNIHLHTSIIREMNVPLLVCVFSQFGMDDTSHAIYQKMISFTSATLLHFFACLYAKMDPLSFEARKMLHYVKFNSSWEESLEKLCALFCLLRIGHDDIPHCDTPEVETRVKGFTSTSSSSRSSSLDPMDEHRVYWKSNGGSASPFSIFSAVSRSVVLEKMLFDQHSIIAMGSRGGIAYSLCTPMFDFHAISVVIAFLENPCVRERDPKTKCVRYTFGKDSAHLTPNNASFVAQVADFLLISSLKSYCEDVILSALFTPSIRKESIDALASMAESCHLQNVSRVCRQKQSMMKKVF